MIDIHIDPTESESEFVATYQAPKAPEEKYTLTEIDNPPRLVRIMKHTDDPSYDGPYHASPDWCNCKGSQTRRHKIICRHRRMIARLRAEQLLGTL